ncbi:MAG: hypothetical protein HYZ62_01665 [Candidatus Andersenbacteria bacterium]|nr:hypothetical protein [Candidatus Andersenbacteria bacterium]
MSQISKLFIGVIVIALALLAAAGQLVNVQQKGLSYDLYTMNAGQLTGQMVVGQTFVAQEADLSAVAVQFATYSNRHNTKPVSFHLYEFPTLGEPLRRAQVDAAHLADNQMHRFSFAPVANSQGKTYLFTLASSQSVPGDAVTVDLDSRDPYYSGAAYIIRDTGGSELSLGLLSAWGKPTVDVTFETFHTVPLRQAVVDTVVSTIRTLVGTWPSRQGHYRLLGQVALQSVVVLLAVWLFTPGRYERLSKRLGKRRLHGLTLFGLLLLGAGLRMLYATSLPVTSDEGNYLYDARIWLQGNFAGGDGYVKAPLVIAWIAVWEFMMGTTLLAGRMSSVVIGTLTVLPLYFLIRELWNARVALLGAVLFICTGAGIVFHIYVHTQPLALFFGISGLAVLLMALRGTTPRLTFVTVPTVPSSGGWFFLAGMLLGLGVASRKSILALGLLPLLFIGLEGKSWKLRAKHVLHVGLGFAFVIAIFLFFAWYVYGAVGVQEAIGINSAEDGITATDPSELEQVRAYSLKGMTPFFRESLPLILLFALGMGVAGEAAVRSVSRILAASLLSWKRWVADTVLPKAAFLPAWIVFWWAWSFFSEYEGSAFMFWGVPMLWTAFAVLLLLLTLLPKSLYDAQFEALPKAVNPEKSQQPKLSGEMKSAETYMARYKDSHRPTRFATSLLTSLVWMGGLSFFYYSWIKFHANYIAEFIPPLIPLAAFGLSSLFERMEARVFLARDYPALELLRRGAVLVVAGVIFWGLFVSNYITFMFEHTGTFDQTAAQTAATWAKEHIPLSDTIFTGAALVPYLSGHHVSLDIAHPRWYAYDFTRENPERVNAFLPSAQAMVDAYRQARWILMDSQTRFSFFMEYPELERSFAVDFVPVKEIDNLSNTLTFYQRIR